MTSDTRIGRRGLSAEEYGDLLTARVMGYTGQPGISRVSGWSPATVPEHTRVVISRLLQLGFDVAQHHGRYGSCRAVLHFVARPVYPDMPSRYEASGPDVDLALCDAALDAVEGWEVPPAGWMVRLDGGRLQARPPCTAHQRARPEDCSWCASWDWFCCGAKLPSRPEAS